MISNRLIFEKIEEKDRERYVSQVMNSNVMRYITGCGLTFKQANQRFEEALSFGDSHAEFGIFTVCLKDAETYIGLARMKKDADESIEIGYNLLEAYWGKGFGSEIGETLMQFLKNRNEDLNIYAIVMPENIGSVKILEKLNLTKSDENRADNTVIYRLSLDKQQNC
jgi:[ribosomal protein S5]-alanine N-acetyltransferase